MIPTDPTPVKLFCGILYSDNELLQKAVWLLKERYGDIDYKSKMFPFDMTSYYETEMGSPIYRVFYSFTRLINPKLLAQIKIECNRIEDDLAHDNQRKVNLDPGYMDYDKVVLASAKYKGHKIYLDFGIYADPTLRYEKGHYTPGEWCFPDFKTGLYEKDFMEIRAKYKDQLKNILKQS
ncbi:DUF4416 family protein [candidate division KSB1 bacterium]|nr:DUF4416 family protein [candidate division KSB1 bacterium]